MTKGLSVRDVLTTVLELAGFGALVVAGALIAPALGFAVAGVSLVTIGYLLGRPRR